MLRNTRKFTSLFLAATLILVLFSPVPVNATESESTQTAVLHNAYGSEISESLHKKLTAYGVTVTDNTLLQVIASGSGSGTKALLVTNTEASRVKKELLMVYNTASESQPIIPPSPEASLMSSGYGGEMDIFHDDSVVFSWAVLYDIENLDSYVRPLHAQFVCYFDKTRYSITDAEMLYATNGYECDNQYNPIDGRPWYQEHVEYEHVIEISRDTVLPRTYQTNSNAYRADRLICISPGGHHTVNVVFYLNNEQQFDFWDLTVSNWG